MPLCRSCSGFRQSAPDECDAGLSPKFGWPTLDGSLQRSRWCASLERWHCRLSHATEGHDSYLRRRGESLGALFSSRVRPPAPPVPTRVSTHAMTAGTTHDSMTGQRISYEALCLGSNESCELSNILLTALARTAQWTGVFVAALVALACSEAFIVLTCIRLPGVRSPMMNCCYSQISNSLSHCFSPSQHTHCTP